MDDKMEGILKRCRPAGRSLHVTPPTPSPADYPPPVLQRHAETPGHYEEVEARAVAEAKRLQDYCKDPAYGLTKVRERKAMADFIASTKTQDLAAAFPPG